MCNGNTIVPVRNFAKSFDARITLTLRRFGSLITLKLETSKDTYLKLCTHYDCLVFILPKISLLALG